jgi:hypothetical protein
MTVSSNKKVEKLEEGLVLAHEAMVIMKEYIADLQSEVLRLDNTKAEQSDLDVVEQRLDDLGD